MSVVIGGKFRPEPAYHRDTETGSFWERLPSLSPHDLRVQTALLRFPVLGTAGNTCSYALPSEWPGPITNCNLGPDGSEQQEYEHGTF